MEFFNNSNPFLDETLQNVSCHTSRRNFGHIEYVEEIYVVCNIINSALALATALCNAIILWVIWRLPSLHTPSFVLLFNLALSDFGVGVLALPPYVIKKTMEIRLFRLERLSDAWNSALSIYCKSGLIADIFGTLFASASYFFLVTISVERYQAISLHLRYNQVVTTRRTMLIAFFVWIFATSMVIFRFTLELKIVIKVYSLLIVTVVIVVHCNLKIAITLRRHTLQIASQGISGSITAVGLTKFKKSMITLCLIFGLLLICYVPFAVSALVFSFGIPAEVYITLMAISTSIVYLNSFLNPIVYCLRMGEIRAGVRATFAAVGSRCRQHVTAVMELSTRR